ncbi:uncharacterized protein LOC9654453 [Selaginella moellendorffii]|uniref:uncharacterized protein LOC9654453 n=1 Tax=Selaginella moellendorffii TaxID=88036 RepID=UPI000D1CBF2A|nr:uncharacterized protein LOC9654453 [Selaginella moellendorffii]|eukprot:XP_024544119.1 uncharacterized protein LOC9654453 [Selaginella moellendorffii]
MSDRFFDKDKFASEQMIFFRSDQGSSEPDLEVSSGGMYTVYTQYVATYLKSLHSLEPNEDPGFCLRCHEKQAAYDRYLADRDPAFKVFSSYFGTEWTQKFCYKFLCPGISIPCHKAKQRQ